MKGKSESELIEMYISGNDDSLGVIYMTYYKLFLAVSKKYLCSTEDAEDLVSSVLERLLSTSIESRIQRYGKVRSVKNFFYTVIKNASLDRLRKKKLNCVSIDYALNSSEESVDDAFIILQYNNVGLSKSEALCFEEYLSGKRPREISVKHSKSVSTVKNTLTNAKRKILTHYRQKNYLLE